MIGESLASLCLCVVVAAHVLDPTAGPISSTVALGAIMVLGLRVACAGAVELLTIATALPGVGGAGHCDQSNQKDIEQDPSSVEALPPLARRRRARQVVAPPDAGTVAYQPFASIPLPAGLPQRAPKLSVADKLDQTLSVFDFIPAEFHAAIRLNKQLTQGNKDVTKYFQAAIDFVDPLKSPLSTLVIVIPTGRYFVGNLTLRNGIMLRGEQLNSTMLCPVPGTKGSWLKNTGNAGKISIERIRFYGNNELGIMCGIELGSPPGQEWGDYSDLRDLEVSNLPNAVGIKLQVNVSVLYNVWTEQTHDGILNMPGGCCLMAFGCGAMAFRGTGIRLQIADYWSGTEIEAPLDGSIPVEIQGAATIDGILIGPPNSLVNGKGSHYKTLIKVDSAAAGPWGLPGGWRGGKPAHSSSGWSVSGLVVDNSGGWGSWDETITVDGKGVSPSFTNTSTLTVSESVLFGDTMLPKYVPSTNALYVDPTSKKLCFKDHAGKLTVLSS